ncbi:MAG: adenylate/guanylate cyclase domain-containing protein [Oscillospiraceae bacterium]|nr:adenylate/guanylate cyclase domain-containing protein [Oscillospiraceae bacterium]
MKKTIACILSVMIAFSAAFFNIFDMAGQIFEDSFYHRAGSIDPNIRIICIDERTMERLGDFSEWDREVYADLVQTLCVSENVRPAVIGFDILFGSEKESDSDARLAEACAAHGNVVTGFSYVFAKELTENSDGSLTVNAMTVTDCVKPYPALAAVTESGFVNALMDGDDGLIRSAFLRFAEKDGGKALSFDAAVYEAYMRSLGKDPAYPTESDSFRFRYSAGVSEYENVSLIDVLDKTVPAQAFDDCIVLVGAYAGGMMDAYFVPVDRSRQMYGVEIHANVIQAILEGKTLTTQPAWADGVIAAAVIGVLFLMCGSLNIAKVILLCLGAAAAKLGIGAVLFRFGYTWEHLAVPIMAIVIAVYHILLRYYHARQARRNIENAFKKYVAPQIVSEIARNGSYELKLGGENRDIAVLFVDIRGFTSLSESLQPEQVVDILNGYLTLTTRCIFRHGGTLDKFIGDATMAVFNAPFDTEDYEMCAVKTAWDIVMGGSAIEEDCMARYNKAVGFGVGVNCGPAIVGNIGCDFRMDYTAIGDTVNTAARLESNAPRGMVYISDEVYQRLKDRITVSKVGEIPLKGKSNNVFVYAVTDIPGYSSPEGKKA